MKILRKHLKGPVLIFGGEGALGSEIAQRLELNGIMVLKTKHSEFSINPSKSEIYKYIHYLFVSNSIAYTLNQSYLLMAIDSRLTYT